MLVPNKKKFPSAGNILLFLIDDFQGRNLHGASRTIDGNSKLFVNRPKTVILRIYNVFSTQCSATMRSGIFMQIESALEERYDSAKVLQHREVLCVSHGMRAKVTDEDVPHHMPRCVFCPMGNHARLAAVTSLAAVLTAVELSVLLLASTATKYCTSTAAVSLLSFGWFHCSSPPHRHRTALVWEIRYLVLTIEIKFLS